MGEIGTYKRISHEQPRPAAGLRKPARGDIVKSVFLFLAGRASILTMSPFSVAMFAAGYDKSIAYLGILVLTGALMTAGVGLHVAKYLFAALVFLVYTHVKEDYRDHKILSSAVCGGGLLAGGVALFAYQSMAIYDVMLLFVESILSAFAYIVFDKANSYTSAKRSRISQEELICVCISTGVLIMGFSGIPLPFGIKLTHVLSMYAVMVIALNGNLGGAGAGGLATGLICGMDSSNVIQLVGLYGMCGIFGNLLKTFGKWGVALGFIAANCIAMLYTGSVWQLPVGISELFLAAGLFVLTPKGIHYRISAFFSKAIPEEGAKPELRMKEYLSMRLDSAANAFSRLGTSFSKLSEKRLQYDSQNVATMFDDTADRVCKGCSMAVHCWQKEFNDTYQDMFQILSALEKSGHAQPLDAPERFRGKCIRLEQFLTTLNHVYELYKQNAVWVGEMAQSRNLVADQYTEIAHIMRELSYEIEDGFSFLEDMEIRLLEELDKQGIAAKEVSVLENGIGNLEAYVSLSDGADRAKVCDIVSMVLDTPMKMEGTARKNCMKLTASGMLSVDVGVAQRPKEGEEENGDSAVWFCTEDNHLVLALSDGMGSGEAAMEESTMTTELLTEFLKAGFAKDSSVNIINSSLALKSGEEMFSTIDLAAIDLLSGETDFWKVGASESFVKHKDDIDTIFSTSLPAGMLPSVKADSTRKTLSRGDVIVMVSDGVGDAGKSLIRGEWIKKEMMQSCMDAQEMAQRILDGALKRSRRAVNDDMSVIVARIEAA